MIKLDYWLPEKEMFGCFSLESLTFTGDTLEAVASNEVFQFTISFPRGVSACSVTQTSRARQRLDALRAEHEVYMRGNTFFKLEGDPFFAQANGQKGDVHYLIAAPNYTVDILASASPAVALAQAKKRGR